MVQSVDESVARILGALEELGSGTRTLVVLTSDNGGVIGVADNGGLREGKGFLYEGGIRVPLIVRWPGVVEPGATCPGSASGADLLPTICTAVDAPLPEDLDGRDLTPLLRRPDRAWGGTPTCRR